jgi:hypothetical protein
MMASLVMSEKVPVQPPHPLSPARKKGVENSAPYTDRAGGGQGAERLPKKSWIKLLITIVLWLLLCCLVALVVCNYSHGKRAWDDLNLKLQKLSANREKFAYVVVFLDRSISVKPDGKINTLLEAYKKGISKSLLPKLGAGDKLTIYFIDDSCGFGNYLVQADEIPGFGAANITETLHGVLEHPDLLHERSTRIVIDEIQKNKAAFEKVVANIQKLLVGVNVKNTKVGTDVYCAFDELPKFSPGDSFEKWLYVFSDFVHRAPSLALSDGARSAIATGNWNIRLISNISSTQQRNIADKTILQIESAVQDRSKYRNISIGELDTNIPGNSPSNDWEKLKGYDSGGFMDHVKSCLKDR